MEKKILPLVTAGFVAMGLLFSLASCSQEGDTNNTYILSSSAKEENKNFESIAIPLVSGTDDDVKDTVFARIYEKNEYLPYAGIRYWLEFLNVKIEDMSYSDGEYTITGKALGKSFPLVVNVKDSTIYCPAWAGFADPAPGLDFTQNGNPGKMVESKKTYVGQKAATFNLGKYGFKIYGGIDDAYVPLCVLNQLFTGPLKNAQILYNGKKLYQYSQQADFTTFKDSSWYTTDDGSICERPAALVEASYNLLCFTHDNLYGCPGYYGFADDEHGHAKADEVAAADALSLDDLLTNRDPNTKALLKSTSYLEYLKGLTRFTYYTYGDEHASIKWDDQDFIMFDNADIKAAVKEITKNGCSGKWKFDRQKSDVKNTNSLNYWRKDKEIIDENGNLKSNKVLELTGDGKTLIIRFDSFDLDQSGGWQKYYAYANANDIVEPDPDAENMPLPNDTIALFYKAFYYILHNRYDCQNVTTVLIDDSCNGGGAKPVMQYILYLITGKGDLYYDDVRTGTKYHEITKADLNLDGVIDSKDEDYRKKFFGERSTSESSPCRGLNVAILTSFNSFSCGNGLPCFAKERGIKIIGEQSGGGSCVVGSGVTADGFPYNYSCNDRLSAQDFSKSVEGGAEVDISLLDGDSYEKFFNNDDLIAVLQELFPDTY